MTNLEFPNEFAAIAYEFLYFNITIALRMHLRDVQIWRRLPCYCFIVVRISDNPELRHRCFVFKP